ncbi:aminopeptidase N [Thermochromatium tepidum]|uniref:Aminopeptidase N n=1 Tax=Thermochromatium tepidum ATCC 43061 TaxID=316276 RepID=A0A6I6E8W7_THETI|nr:aminopeptidase N [Thermochromatium tepidum]QGU33018.1 aminopeptidase N [Thermochromatium tepidum ATCC 43061]
MYRETPQPIHLKDYRPPEFLIDRVELRFELDPECTHVESRLDLRRNPAAPPGGGDLWLDGEELRLTHLAIDGRVLASTEYRVDPRGLTLYQVPDRFTLETQVEIEPSLNTALKGLYQSGDLLCTQCEAENFRRITYFLDRPDVLARYTTTLIADQARFPVLLSNGNPIARAELTDGRHSVTWEDPFPKPSYLFALVAGDLSLIEDRFVTASGREVRLQLFVEPHNRDKGEHALNALKKAMRWDEERFGREYDLDFYMIVAVSHFNMGAMENKGLNIFNDKFVLARPDTATDADFDGIESIIAHEYFHNWTGNRITCRDWFQLSLKEGLTVYRDQEFSSDVGSRAVKRIRDVRALRTHQFAEDAGPLAHPVRPESYIEIDNFYTATVYDKGAELVRMQSALLGPTTFRHATDLYFARHDGQAVTIEDFVRCMEDASGRDLSQFRRWYEQAGTPELFIRGHYDAATWTYTLNVRQETPPTPNQPIKRPLHIPLAIGLLGPDGRESPVWLAGEPEPPAPGTRLLELTEPEQQFVFTGLSERPVPSILRGFSAPVRVHDDLSDADRLFLMAHDRDGFCRWDAAQTLHERLILALVADETHPIPEDYLAAFRHALGDTTADRALLAEMLTLPSETYLGDRMAVIDVEGLHRAHRHLMCELGCRLRTELLAIYDSHAETGPYVFAPEAVGRRALKNLALSYLVYAGDESGLACCRAQFETAHNMTDVMAALGLLVDQGGDEAEAALQSFYRRWTGEPLVIDKWFSVQAKFARPDALERVKALIHHPDYSPHNPNRVRALVGTFAKTNQVCFHAVDGSGYRFLVDQVLELDPINPVLAAQLLKPFERWRRFDAGRQALMRTELERILGREGLSSDVFEVASKALA